MDHLAELLSRQAGVLSRQQALQAGLEPHDLRRLVRRRELSRVHAGVYVDHTGELTWLQRAWAAVLLVAPGALCHDSAIRAVDGPGRPGRDRAIQVAVDRHRHLAVPSGVHLHRLVDLDAKVLWNASPPRVRIEYAVLAVAGDAGDDFEAVRVLADAVQSRRTTAARLLGALDLTPRLPRRPFLRAVLVDLEQGACSVLERGYLRLVERAHRLPTAARQVRGSSRGPVYRDVVYERYRQLVELDGRLFHDDAASRHADLERDLDAAVDGLSTVRLGWGQVYGTPCRTADRIGALLRRRGWTGRPAPCRLCG